jgi:hypothetical protein
MPTKECGGGAAKPTNAKKAKNPLATRSSSSNGCRSSINIKSKDKINVSSPAPRGRARHQGCNVSDNYGAVKKAKAKAELNNNSNTTERGNNSSLSSKANNATSPAPVEWKKSEAKKYLKQQLKDDNSPFHAMDTRSIYESDKRFTVYPFKNFSTNCRNLKKKIKKRTKPVLTLTIKQ